MLTYNSTGFLAEGWHIRTHAQFAGSCIGVILLVVFLEFLRRSSKEYDAFILRKYISSHSSRSESKRSSADSASLFNAPTSTTITTISATRTFRPSLLQQAIRSLLHMLQFAVAYLIMLLAMYYNGYLILSIFLGSYIGAFIFSWQTVSVSTSGSVAAEEATSCCG
jgi:solute carrier family 31 (copper transporter), member 1